MHLLSLKYGQYVKLCTLPPIDDDFPLKNADVCFAAEGTQPPAIGFSLHPPPSPPTPILGPQDEGPDKALDRPGNDYVRILALSNLPPSVFPARFMCHLTAWQNCFAVNASFTPLDCAAACAADPKCMAWTTIGVASDEDLIDQPDRMDGALIACSHGQPLGSRYCTLKAPVPNTITKSASAYTGLPATALHGHGAKNTTAPTTTTTMLMDVKAEGDATRSTRVLDMVAGRALPQVRDTTAAFECGAKKNVTCLPATTTGVSAGAHPFMLFARHGTFELYVGEPLMLVQTMTYGTYPVAKARLGLAVQGDGGRVGGLKAWGMSLTAL